MRIGIGVARGGHGRAFALLSLNFSLPSKPSSYLNCIAIARLLEVFITYLRVIALAHGWLANEL